jgi:drug/metabolite transporter (DMT)-like permease
MKFKHIGVLLGLAAIWGASFLFIKVAVQSDAAPGNFPPMTLVGLRIGMATLLLYAILKVRGGTMPWRHSGSLAVLGLVNAAIPYFLFSWGEQFIDSNLAAIYNATTPLFTVILAWLVVQEERLSGVRSMGVVVGFLGILYLFSDSLQNIGSGANRLHILGELACVGAAFCYGLGNMWARRRLRGLQPLQLATAQMFWGTLWTLPIILLVEQPWRTLAPTPQAIAALAALSLLGTAIAQIFYFFLLTEVGATRTAQVTYLLPIFGLFWGSFIGEPITPRIVGALLIVLLGLVIVNGGVDRLRRVGGRQQGISDREQVIER